MSSDVSRGEYDAALTRLQAASGCAGVNAEDCAVEEEHVRCVCADLTLAALGLDEPPTEPFERMFTFGGSIDGTQDVRCKNCDWSTSGPTGSGVFERADEHRCGPELDEPPTEEEPVSDAKAIYENLPPEAVAAAAAFIRGLFYNQEEDDPLDEALAARNCATHILHAAGWVPPAEPPKAGEADVIERIAGRLSLCVNPRDHEDAVNDLLAVAVRLRGSGIDGGTPCP